MGGNRRPKDILETRRKTAERMEEPKSFLTCEGAEFIGSVSFLEVFRGLNKVVNEWG
jgi:hypothetical protein